MLVDEMQPAAAQRSFVKKNNSYSHCPLKKRPVNVVLLPTEDAPAAADIKGELTYPTTLTQMRLCFSFCFPSLLCISCDLENS